MPAPKLIGVIDDGDGVALMIEWIDGRMPTAPLSAEDVASVLAVVSHLSECGEGVNPPGVGPRKLHGRRASHWASITDDSLADRLDPWSRRHLPELVRWELLADEAVAGDTLLHGDLRSDNLLLGVQNGETGNGMAVDWPQAAMGAPWVDLVGLLAALHLDGAPPPAELFDHHPLSRGVDPDQVNALLAFLAGYLTRNALLPAPPGLPTLRAFQEAQGVIVRSWLAERLLLR